MNRQSRAAAKEAVLAGILLWILVNVFFVRIEYKGYQEKIELICLTMEAEEEDPMFLVTQYLKGASLPQQEGTKQLSELGFSGPYLDRLKMQFIRNVAFAMGITALLFLLFYLGLWILGRRNDGSRAKEAELLREMIEDLREEKYDRLTIGEEVCGRWEQSDGFERLRMDLVSLAEQIQLLTQAARREKENTKALATDLSHQLKTPVTALKASFDVLQSDMRPEVQREFLERCRGQIARLEELTGALIQISRMETGMIEIKTVEAPIFDTLLLAVNRIYPKAAGKQIEIILEESGDGAEYQVIRQDTKWLCEAVINVLENAVKYSGEGTSVRIRVQRLSVYLRIEIEDEGFGVPREERSQIFQRFYRGRRECIRKESGQGIGLYLARYIIERHGGTIKVVDARKQGSIFVIQLPL